MVASQLYYSCRIIRWELDRSYGSRAPSRSYAVSAPANPVPSQQYCYIMWELILHCTRGGGGGGGAHTGCGAAAHYVHGVLINWKLAKSPARDALKVPCTVWKMMMLHHRLTKYSVLTPNLFSTQPHNIIEPT